MSGRPSLPVQICIGLIVSLLPMGAVGGLEPVRVNGREFQVCNQNFRFMGFNLRGICHYGRGDVLPYSYTGDIATNLDYCVAAGSKVIRVFCAYASIGPVQTGNRLQTVLDVCEQRGMYAIIALTDMYGGTQLHPMGDGGYFTNGLLNHAFFSSGYRVNYLPQAVYLADRFKNHPSVFAWQLGNEIRDIGNPATYAAFAVDVAAQIRAADPNHLVSTGLIGYQNTQLTFSQAQQLYASFDFVNSHNYNGDETNDHNVAAALNKPYVVDEAGFDSGAFGPDRTGVVNSDISKWVGRGARGYMQWGLMATSYDNGDGDRIFGVDPVFHNPDFTAYRNLFAQWATTLMGQAPPPALEVIPASLAPTLVAGRSASDVCEVWNTGTGSFAFTVSTAGGPSWLSVSPTSGSAGCTPTPLQVRYETDGMLPGVHAAEFEVLANGVAGSPATVTVTLTLTRRPADLDGDNDVDQTDFGAFQACFSGVGVPQSNPGCAGARLDEDTDVDHDDLVLFLQCMSGPNLPCSPDCTE